MIGPAFTYQSFSKDFIFNFIKIWALIFVRPKAVTDLKNALYYPLTVYIKNKKGKVLIS